MRRNLDEQIRRMKKLSLIKEAGEINIGGGAQDEMAEDRVDELLSSPDFERQLEVAIKQFVRNLPNQLNLIANRSGDRDGNIESKPNPNLKRGLPSMQFNEAILPPKMAEQLGIALRRSGTEFDVQSLRDAGNILSKIGRDLYRRYNKSIYLGIKPMTSQINDAERKELAEKILIASLLISTVWYIQASIGGIKGGTLSKAENESEDMFKAIKINLPRWINSITSFKIY